MVAEVKSVDALLPVHQAQVLTYLCLTGCPAGLLINFNVPRLTDGVRRLLNAKREGVERTEHYMSWVSVKTVPAAHAGRNASPRK